MNSPVGGETDSNETTDRESARFSWPAAETIFAFLLERSLLAAADFDGFSSAADELDRLVSLEKRLFFEQNDVSSRPVGVLDRIRRFIAVFFSHPAKDDFSDGSALSAFSDALPDALPLGAILPVGAYRRREESFERLEMLAASDYAAELFDLLEHSPLVESVLRRERDSLTLRFDVKALRLPGWARVPLTVRTVRPESFFTAALFETASSNDWAFLTRQAAATGLRLERAGLFEPNGDRVPIDSTEAIYERLALLPQPMELLATGTPFRRAAEEPYRLLTTSQIRGDLHVHTSYSDGTASMEEMVSSAIARRLEYVALTDHTERCYVAGGMDARRFRHYWKKIDRLNQRIAASGRKFRVLKGAEVDILPDGTLDLGDDDLAKADWVVASVHFELRQDRAALHRRIERALANPYVCVLAHPTQRSFASGFKLDLDPEFLVETARKYGKFLELNAQPHRLDLNSALCRLAKERGVKIVLSTDAHSPEQLANTRFGVGVARRAGLTADDLVNTLPLDELLARRAAILERHERELFEREAR